MMPHPKLFLIDAHALCYRSYFAIKGLSTKKGQATNAVYGFVSTLKKILREYKPQYVAVCFDVGKKTFRQEKFADYKIQRPSMPADLISQIPLIKEVVRAYNLPVLEYEGYEADDLIATVARQMVKKDVEVVVVSDDKDMYQLLNGKIKIFSVRKEQMIGEEEAKAELGIEPQRIIDFIALAGDTVDNIPGVNGIGEVTARSLIQEHGSLENIFRNLSGIKSEKIREKLSQQREIAFLSKELAILDAHVGVPVRLNDMVVGVPDQKRLYQLFQELEFRKFAEELRPEITDHDHLKTCGLKDEKDIKELTNNIRKAGQFSFLIEGSEQETLFSGMVISMGDENIFQVREDQIVDLKELFEDHNILKITHNIKEAMKVLISHGCRVEGKMFDVMLGGYLLNPAQSSYDVVTLAWEYLKCTVSERNRLASSVKIVETIYPLILKQLQEKSLMNLFHEIEMPLAYVLFQMETNGVRLDEDLLKELSHDCEKKIKSLEEQIYEEAGSHFNLNSPKQLSAILFGKLKLPVIKKTKTGFSTDEGVLTKLATQHKLPALILNYRQLAKLKSTYIDALPKLVNPQTHRLHTYFNQVGTETGRLSSNDPNLQNIPIRTDLGRQIRKAFVASGKGNVIIAADYSQIELRILAHLSGDKNLIKAFQDGEDIHTYTAALIFDVSEEVVSAEMRDAAKRVNFGIIYGMSAFGLSKDLNISQNEAQDFIDKYFLRYPDVKKFMDEQIGKCEEAGFVMTILNRRRYLPEINSTNVTIRQLAQRQAINTPVQGSAADLLKLVMIKIQKEMERHQSKAKMIITVHDELVFDVPVEEEGKIIEFIKTEMEHPIKLSVPIKVSIKSGPNWLDMKEI